MVLGYLQLSDVSVICRVTYLQLQACFSSTSVRQQVQWRTWFTQYQTSPKIWGVFLYGVYRPWEWLWIDSNGKKMETRHPVEGSFDSEFPWSIISVELWTPKVAGCYKKFIAIFCIFSKTTTCGKIIKIVFQKFLSHHQSTCCVQILWNLADGKSVKSCIAYLTKKICLALQLSLLRWSHPKFARASRRQCTQEYSRFHSDRFTFGGVIAECVNTANTHCEANPVFGWS